MSIIIYTKIYMMCNMSITSFYNELRQPITSSVDQPSSAERGNRLQRQRSELIGMPNNDSQGKSIIDLAQLVISEGFLGEEVLLSPEDRFFKKLMIDVLGAKNHTLKSDIFSPYAFCSAICMLLMNATGNTKQDLLKLLDYNICTADDAFPKDVINIFDELNSEKVKAACLNFVCHDKNTKIDADFKISADTADDDDALFPLKKFYCISVETNFNDTLETILTINNMIDNITDNIFNESVCEIPVDRPLVIINTIYFKVPWLHPFDSAETKEEDFFGYENSFKVQMMKQSGIYKFLKDDNLNFLALNLDDKNSNLYLVLCMSDTEQKIPLELHLACKKLLENLLDDNCPSYNVDLQLPKFKIESICNLNNVFNKTLCSDFLDKDLELRNISGSSDTTKINMLHKAVVEINESGICTQETNSSKKSHNFDLKLNTTPFICNKPFVFTLYYKTQSKNEEDELETIMLPLLVGRFSDSNN